MRGHLPTQLAPLHLQKRAEGLLSPPEEVGIFKPSNSSLRVSYCLLKPFLEALLIFVVQASKLHMNMVEAKINGGE